MPQTLERQPALDIRETLFGNAPITSKPAKAARPKARWWIWAIAAVVVIASVVAWRTLQKPAAAAYGTARIARGTVAKTISATGRVQALRTVDVGTQASGTISDIYVDFNSQVKKGQVIARLDPSQLQTQLTQATANLAGAQASVQTAQSAALSADAGVAAAQANVDRLDSVVKDAQQNLDRTRDLVAAGVTPRKDLDTAQNALSQALAQKQQGVAQMNQARAQTNSARSQMAQARAQVAQASASVQLASVNMQHTIITAPIDGVIVSRNVDVGQTVAASLQAPTLFLIANDLTHMQVLADIDEADVGQLQPNTDVTFTVDAYPAETFRGKIEQIRLAPQTVQNVVTYTAVINVDNPDLKLKPGMTANVTATVSKQQNVLTAPAAALRFRPENAAPSGPARPGGGTLYVVNGKKLEPVRVRTGLSDGAVTQIVSGDVNEGDVVAVPATADRQRAGAARPAGGMFGAAGGRGAGRIR
jgi:HlyD family secretion protein